MTMLLTNLTNFQNILVRHKIKGGYFAYGFYFTYCRYNERFFMGTSAFDPHCWNRYLFDFQAGFFADQTFALLIKACLFKTSG